MRSPERLMVEPATTSVTISATASVENSNRCVTKTSAAQIANVIAEVQTKFAPEPSCATK